MSTRSSPEEIQQKAQFRLEQADLRKRDADKSFAEYETEKRSELAKTVRLRALRLAKEAKDAVDELAAAERIARENATRSLAKKRARKKATLELKA